MRMTFGELIYSSYRASLSGTYQRLDTTFNLYLRKMLTLSIPRQDETDSGYHTAGRSFKSGSDAPEKNFIFLTRRCRAPSRVLAEYQCDLNIQYHRRRAISAQAVARVTKGSLRYITCQNKNQYFLSRSFLFRRMIGRNRASPPSIPLFLFLFFFLNAILIFINSRPSFPQRDHCNFTSAERKPVIGGPFVALFLFCRFSVRWRNAARSRPAETNKLVKLRARWEKRERKTGIISRNTYLCVRV